jgi:hypothetical protein
MDANGDHPGREAQRRTGYATQANALFRKNLALQVVALVFFFTIPRTSEICLSVTVLVMKQNPLL